MSISSVSEFELLLVGCLDQTPLQLEMEGIKEREDGERAGSE